MATSLKQIAEEAQVSLATVSKALSGRSDVSDATRRRIVEVAQRLRYRPNLLVHGIQTGRSQTMGVMVPVGDDGFLSQIVTGIHNRLTELDYAPLLLWCNRRLDGSWEGATELEQIHRLIDRRVDGLILRPLEDAASDDYLHEIREHRLPLVAVDRALPNAHLADFVGTDDRAGGRLAAEHLLALGHRRLAHLAGPSFTSTGRDRRAGFEEVLRETPNVHYTVAEDPTFSHAEEAAQHLLRLAPVPTAIFTGNDYQASVVYRTAAQLGLAVGRDLSVIGFADLPFAPWMAPPLTTLRQQPREIGRRAVDLVIRRIEARNETLPPVYVRLPVTLVQRQSTAPPVS